MGFDEGAVPSGEYLGKMTHLVVKVNTVKDGGVLLNVLRALFPPK